MALILNIETATEVCSVALAENGKLLSLREENKANSHSSVLTVLIQQAFETSGRRIDEMDAVAVSAGPGSFTGLRIGAAAAKGLCYSLEIPLIAVPTLKAMARGIIESARDTEALYCPVLESIKEEVFAGLYTYQLYEVVEAAPQEVQLKNMAPFFASKKVFISGNGAEKLRALPDTVHRIDIPNSARHMIGVSHDLFLYESFEPLENFEPQYLKKFVPRIST